MVKVSATVNAPIEKVWSYWTLPEHIMQWNHASDDWHCPAAKNDLRVGKGFVATMATKDGSASFEFSGTYTDIDVHKRIAYVMDDGRKVEVLFEPTDEGVLVTELFDAENENSKEVQRQGWQAILDNFKRHVEEQ